jgi:hypothetical protein
MVAEYSTESFQRDRRCLGNVAIHRREADEVEAAIERVVSWRSCRRRAHVAPSGIGMIGARHVFLGEIKALSLHGRFGSDSNILRYSFFLFSLNNDTGTPRSLYLGRS